MKPTLLWSSIALLLTVSACQEPETTASVIRPAQVWTVTDTHTANTLTFSGETQARLAADLAFRVGGKVIKRQVDPGDTVKAGQVLASLDTSTDITATYPLARQ